MVNDMKVYIKRSLSGLTLLLVATGLSTGLLATEADPILMSDRGQVVHAQELRRAWQALPPAEQTRLLAPGGGEEVLARLLRQKLMAAEAVRLGLDQEPRIQAKLEDARLAILGAALRERVEADTPLPDLTDLARERYATRQAELTTQGEYQVAHILLRVACEAEREAKLSQIQDLRAQLNAGADFAALARDHSEDASAAAGGQLPGWISPQELDPDFAQALTQLADGGISEPIKTRYGYHLIQRQAHRPAGVKPFEEVSGQLEKEIRAAYLRTRLAEAQAAFNPSADAQLDQAALQAVLAELAASPVPAAGAR